MAQKKTKQKLRKKRQNSKRRSRRVRGGGKIISTTPTVKTLIAVDESYLYPTNKIKNIDFQTYFLTR